MWKSTIKTRVLNSIGEVSSADWNGLLPARGAKGYHPFTDWHFLSALEDSGSACADTGWQPLHLWLEDENGAPHGAAPLYAKYHSMGEYVFDQGWADAGARAGMAYYPKLQCAVPFTPAGGPRLFANSSEGQGALISALQNICTQNNMSGAHVTFIDKALQDRLAEHGFLARTDRQFHFVNRGYATFDDFLSALTARKRKKIKSERRRACEQVTIKRLRGDDITPAHWDAFYEFYVSTSERKWGRAYLSRDFYHRIHSTMREQVLLVMAYDRDTPIAGALNFIGGDTLYGRHWGASQNVPFLHFELCYYQAIDAAIQMGLARVEAGAQGEHKLARGYEPVTTYSAHYIAHDGLSAAIEDFLRRERRAVEHNITVLDSYSPFRKDTKP